MCVRYLLAVDDVICGKFMSFPLVVFRELLTGMPASQPALPLCSKYTKLYKHWAIWPNLILYMHVYMEMMAAVTTRLRLSKILLDERERECNHRNINLNEFSTLRTRPHTHEKCVFIFPLNGATILSIFIHLLWCIVYTVYTASIF